MRGSTTRVGEFAWSTIDGQGRLVLAEGPGHTRLPRALPSTAEAILGKRGPDARPARACTVCLHPFPDTIDERETCPVLLVGHSAASKTTTTVALISECRSRSPEEFGVSGFGPTQAAIQTLLDRVIPNKTQDIISGDFKDIFDLYYDDETVPLTDDAFHPPLEFDVEYRDGEQLSMFLYDLPGEQLRDARQRLKRAPSLKWADAVILVYDPASAHARKRAGRGYSQAEMFSDVLRDLEKGRYPTARTEPTVIVGVSKADLLDYPSDVAGGNYSDDDVKSTLRVLGDGGVVHATERFSNVHWRFITPRHGTSGPQGVVDLFALTLKVLRDN